jgi:predicted ribosome quality control (RQC) complex YloA/Tae2 family protein
LNHYKNLNKLYSKLKGLKKALPLIEQRRQKALKELKSLTNIISTSQPIPLYWIKTKSMANKEMSQVRYKVYKFKDYKLGVGTNAQSNDQLRIQWASKNDTWFHLDQMKSAHVIYKGDGPVDEMIFRIASSILRDHSNCDQDQVPVVYTLVKYLKGVKKSPGSVLFKKEKRRVVNYLDSWRENLIDKEDE